MDIRLMRIEDYDKVYDLWVHTPGMGLNTVDDSICGIQKYLARNPTTCFVAEDEEKTIGTILAGHDGRRGYIYHVAVHPTYRKQGIGKELVGHAMKALEAQGINRVALVVYKENEGGNTFWERIGFSRREDINYRNGNIHPYEKVDILENL